MTEYTERVDGFQIRDCVYLGLPPEGIPPRFDVVKWYPEPNPHMGTVYYTDSHSGKLVSREQMITEHCYSVGVLEWNRKEGSFDFQSIGLRWIEEKPSKEVCDMILRFCEEKEVEIRESTC